MQNIIWTVDRNAVVGPTAVFALYVIIKNQQNAMIKRTPEEAHRWTKPEPKFISNLMSMQPSLKMRVMEHQR